MNTYTIERNAKYNSIEVTFKGKPSEAVRDALKALRFRWHGVKKVWYGYKDAETVRNAIEQAEQGETEQNGQTTPGADAKEAKKDGMKKAEPKRNKYGVMVGDFFRATWGYEQTNNDFFQVVALVGETSVRVREVNPPLISSEGVSWASENRVFDTRNTGEILPPSKFSSFIKDQERGDLKRLKSYREDGSCPQFFLASFTDAYYCTGDTTKVYESWYA